MATLTSAERAKTSKAAAEEKIRNAELARYESKVDAFVAKAKFNLWRLDTLTKTFTSGRAESKLKQPGSSSYEVKIVTGVDGERRHGYRKGGGHTTVETGTGPDTIKKLEAESEGWIKIKARLEKAGYTCTLGWRGPNRNSRGHIPGYVYVTIELPK